MWYCLNLLFQIWTTVMHISVIYSSVYRYQGYLNESSHHSHSVHMIYKGGAERVLVTRIKEFPWFIKYHWIWSLSFTALTSNALRGLDSLPDPPSTLGSLRVGWLAKIQLSIRMLIFKIDHKSIESLSYLEFTKKEHEVHALPWRRSSLCGWHENDCYSIS